MKGNEKDELRERVLELVVVGALGGRDRRESSAPSAAMRSRDAILHETKRSLSLCQRAER